MKITNTNPELWKCPRCGQGPRDCRCGTSFTAFELAAAALLLAILLLWPSPVAAQCDLVATPRRNDGGAVKLFHIG